MDVIELTRRLVSIPSAASPKQSYREIADFIYNELSMRGIESRLIACSHDDPAYQPGWDVDFRDASSYGMFKKYDIPKYNVVGFAGNGPKRIILHAHIDTVPQGMEEWQYPPFEGHMEDGKLYGLGTADNKSGIAIAIDAMDCVKDILDKVSVSLAFTCDEEMGGYAGAGFLLNKNLLEGDMAVSLNGSAHKINFGCFGRMWLKASSRDCAGLYEWVQSNSSRINDGLQKDGIPALLQKAERLGDAVILVFNYLKEEEFQPQMVLDIIQGLVLGLECDIEIAGIMKPTLSNSCPWVYMFREAAQNAFECEVPLKIGAPSDLRFFISKGINAVSFGSIRSSSCVHRPNEHVIIKDVEDCSKALQLFLRKFAQD